jgi:predicted ribosome quality control (RQC) complex YloA/Tae2 family protein
MKPKLSLIEEHTMEVYGKVLGRELGVQAYDCGENAFLAAWIALGGPIVKELRGDQNWDTDVFATLAKFDGTKCNNKVLAMSSYENLLEQGYFQMERYLLLDPMFVLNMEKFGTKYIHKVKSGVKRVVENNKKSEATIKEQTEEIKALKRDKEKLQAENLEMRGNIERHEEKYTVALDKSEDVPQCNKSEGKRSAATAFDNGRSTHQNERMENKGTTKIQCGDRRVCPKQINEQSPYNSSDDTTSANAYETMSNDD